MTDTTNSAEERRGYAERDDPLARIEDALNRGNRFRRADVSDLAAEVRRYRIIHDQELTFKDLEVKLRDGSLDLRAVMGQEGGNPLFKLVAAFMWHMLLGDEDGPTMPPNYRSCEFELSPAGADRVRMVVEVLAPGGKSSHEIRRQLEAEIEALRDAAPSASRETSR